MVAQVVARLVARGSANGVRKKPDNPRLPGLVGVGLSGLVGIGRLNTRQPRHGSGKVQRAGIGIHPHSQTNIAVSRQRHRHARLDLVAR